MQSLREQFRPEGEGMTEADAIERWELASALGDENTAARAQRAKAQTQMDAAYAVPHEKVAEVPDDPVRAYVKEVSALRAEVAELRPRKRKRRSWKRSKPLKTTSPEAWR
jgi:hypothetical protein